MIIFLFTIFVISILLLIPAILLQSTAETGIFSSNITAGAFGARSNEVLVQFTAWCTVIFVASALAMSIYIVRSTRVNIAPAVQEAPQAPLAPQAPETQN